LADLWYMKDMGFGRGSDIDEGDVSAALDYLSSAGLIELYTKNGERYGFVVGWFDRPDILKRGRGTSPMRRWRKSCLKRDKHTCQECGRAGGELHVHHKASFRKHKELRVVIENGITLCVGCHRHIHSAEGKALRERLKQEQRGKEAMADAPMG